MTSPKIDIVDEAPGSASRVDALLGDETPAPAQSIPTAPQAASSDALARVEQLRERWKLEPIADLQAKATASGRSLLDETKAQARSAQAKLGGQARGAQQSAAKRPTRNADAPAERSTKATGKGYSGVRNLQTAQTLLSKQEKQIADLRAELEGAKLEQAASSARAQVLSSSEGLDELTQGFSSLLAFLFDGVSEMRRLHYESIARREGRPLDADELAAVKGWELSDERAAGIARPFAQYFSTRLGADVLEILPLLIGIAGVGGHMIHGVQGERLAKAERTEMRVMGSRTA